MDRNKQILEHMLTYVGYIEEANDRFQADYSVLESDNIYKLAVTQCLAQIGELTTKLTDEFKEQTAGQIYWRGIKGLRNVVAHNYGSIDNETLWETLECDIPVLKNFCEEQLLDVSLSEEKANTSTDYPDLD